MNRRILLIAATVVAAIVILNFAQRHLAVFWSAFAVRPEMEAALVESMKDQKELARLDPGRRSAYRKRFDEMTSLRNRLEIVRNAQGEIARSYEQIFLLAVALTLVAAAAAYVVSRRREEKRLQRMQTYLERLSSGETRLHVGERGRDAIARFAAMIEETSAIVAEERKRLRYLGHLSSWQEAARRHAHEIRTPLTALQLEVDALAAEMSHRHPGDRALIDRRRENIREELERLRTFTRNFTSFAAIPAPQRASVDAARFAGEFCETYAAAWNAELVLESASADATAFFDRSLVRQVLVNLVTNAALSRPDGARVALTVSGDEHHLFLDVRDNGPGIAESVATRLFEPYTTTRPLGEGMGLGLAIAKKIMLDHSGDLLLLATSDHGTTFRLAIPRRMAR